MPTLPGPISQTPLLQANCVVIKVGGGMGVDDWAAADAAPPRLAATSDPVISRALSGERMTTSPGRRNGRRPCWPDAVTAPGGGPATYSCTTGTDRAAIRFTSRADRPILHASNRLEERPVPVQNGGYLRACADQHVQRTVTRSLARCRADRRV